MTTITVRVPEDVAVALLPLGDLDVSTLDLRGILRDAIQAAASELSRLGLFRRSARVTQRDLAEGIGVDPLTIRHWVNGKAAIPDEYAVALGDFFQVSVPFLMGHAGHDDGADDA